MPDYAALHLAEEARTRRRFVTPEGVDLSLKLADIGQRLGAFILDLLIMLAILIGATVLIATGAFSIGGKGIEAAAIIWLLGFFLLRNGYFILCEMGTRAATFGKRLCGLRVVSRNGGRLTADAVIARNLMREIELYLPLSFLGYGLAEGSAGGLSALMGLGWTCIFLFFPFFNKDRLRIGDLLAGTWVINAPRRKLGLELLGERQEAARFTEEELNIYGVFELQTLERVLRERRPEAMATVAEAIRAKIGSDERSGDEEFLRAYYEALRGRLEAGLLFGKRRENKFSR